MYLLKFLEFRQVYEAKLTLKEWGYLTSLSTPNSILPMSVVRTIDGPNSQPLAFRCTMPPRARLTIWWPKQMPQNERQIRSNGPKFPEDTYHIFWFVGVHLQHVERKSPSALSRAHPPLHLMLNSQPASEQVSFSGERTHEIQWAWLHDILKAATHSGRSCLGRHIHAWPVGHQNTGEGSF